MTEPFHDIESYLQHQGDRVSDYLASIFTNPGHPQVLFSSMNYSLLAGGKRLRPTLCIATAQSFGVNDDEILRVAAALEMVHTYSLIHDDLPCMDNDDLRRGKPTNHKVYGDAMALLAGDALLTYAFEHLATPMNLPPRQQLRLIQILSGASGCYGMVAGQVADMEAENQAGTVEMLKFIHRNKTGKLIQASIEMGAIFAGATDNECAALREFGERIGLVFQIVDDILDVVGDAAELGKQTGVDVERHKVTYPSLLGIDAARELAEETYQDAIRGLAHAGITSPLLDAIGKYIVMRTK